MIHMPDLSVLVATYNRAEVLRQTLEAMRAVIPKGYRLRHGGLVLFDAYVRRRRSGCGSNQDVLFCSRYAACYRASANPIVIRGICRLGRGPLGYKKASVVVVFVGAFLGTISRVVLSRGAPVRNAATERKGD